MGKPTGFMEFDREPAHARPPLERIKDWAEGHPPYPEEVLRQQGARCMDCGVPFCHTGELVAGLATGCPVHNLIPEWNDLIYRGQWEEAIIRLHKTNNFPEFTGRVCPAPCEGSCTLGINAPPVTIKNIEREIVDRAFAAGWVKAQPPLARTGKRVAVVGSGPAGLAAAAQLNRAGHTVTVYERADRVGGLLMYGIPNMKLDKGLVQRRVQLLVDEGVRFVTGTEVGSELPAARLVSDYDATVVCVGATAARDLKVEGRHLSGIHLAMEFLRASTRSLLDSRLQDGKYVSARDRKRGRHRGRRHGHRLRGHGPAPRRAHASPSWRSCPARPTSARPTTRGRSGPRSTSSTTARRRRRRSSAPTRAPTRCRPGASWATSEGRLTGVEIAGIDWLRGENGKPLGPREIEGTRRVIPADLVLLALGFLGPEKSIPSELGLKLDDRGNVVTDVEKMTSVPGVFAAGDCSRGQSLVVWAIREGREAARGVDRYLMNGETVLPTP